MRYSRALWQALASILFLFLSPLRLDMSWLGPGLVRVALWLALFLAWLGLARWRGKLGK
jgi:hypothetical protein